MMEVPATSSWVHIQHRVIHDFKNGGTGVIGKVPLASRVPRCAMISLGCLFYCPLAALLRCVFCGNNDKRPKDLADKLSDYARCTFDTYIPNFENLQAAPFADTMAFNAVLCQAMLVLDAAVSGENNKVKTMRLREYIKMLIYGRFGEDVPDDIDALRSSCLFYLQPGHLRRGLLVF
eukprot:gene19662-26349_t